LLQSTQWDTASFVPFPTIWPPAQTDAGNHLLRAIDVPSGTVRTLAGRQGVSAPFSDGVGSTATFNSPTGVALDSMGTLALVVSKDSEYG
jgi:hypothetical protein